MDCYTLVETALLRDGLKAAVGRVPFCSEQTMAQL